MSLNKTIDGTFQEQKCIETTVAKANFIFPV